MQPAGAVPGDAVDRAVVFDVLPTPYVVLTPDLVIVDANEAYLRVTGRRREELLGSELFKAFPPPAESLDAHGRSEVQRSLEKVVATREPDTLPVQKYPIADADGVMSERHWLAVHVPVLDDAGELRYVVQRTEDITEFSRERERVEDLAERADHDATWQRRAERVEADLFVRARELADAVAAKDAAARQVASLAEVALALTSAATIEDVEQIVVGRGLAVLGAEGGGIISPADGGGWRITVNAALGEHVRRIYRSAPYDSMIPGVWCARTGERLLLPDRAAGLAFDDAVMTAIYTDTGRDAWVFVPLVVGAHTLGSLAAAWVDARSFTPDELDLLDGFAAQCAQALLRIRSTEEQRAAARELQQLAEALQQALLTPPPEPDHLHIVVRYRPAGHHAQVGGDWYDAFLQPDGATMLVIGDVVGHDSVAAAKMGQLRGVLRTLAYDAERGDEPDTPAAILTRLEHAARGLAVDTMATTVLARIEQPGRPGSARRMRWTNAGHSSPVLVLADGTVQFLDTDPDVLLGVDPDAPRRDHLIDLPDESTLLLYTDGLLERRDESAEVSREDLRAVLAELAGADLDTLCDSMLARLAPGAGEDDIALLAVRAHREDAPRPESAGEVDVPAEIDDPAGVPAEVDDPAGGPGAGEAVTVDLLPDVDAPAEARRFLAAHADRVPRGMLDDAELLVSELVGNAVRYGRPAITLGLRAPRDAQAVAVEVTDHGGGELPVLAEHRPDHTRTSGRGLLIVASLAHAWGVRPLPDRVGKTVWFELRATG